MSVSAHDKQSPGQQGVDLSHIEDQRLGKAADYDEGSVAEDKTLQHMELTWEPEEERQAVRKLDWNLVPL